jgi:hypothetical protein
MILLYYLPLIVVVLLSMLGGGFLVIIFHYSSVCNSGGVHICFGREGFLMILSSVVSVEKTFYIMLYL